MFMRFFFQAVFAGLYEKFAVLCKNHNKFEAVHGFYRIARVAFPVCAVVRCRR